MRSCSFMRRYSNRVLSRRPGCVGTDTQLRGTLTSQLVVQYLEAAP
jgi:hypothetical protein